MLRLSSGKLRSIAEASFRTPLSRVALLFVAVGLWLAPDCLAQQPGLSQGQIHNPFSSRYNALTPAYHQGSGTGHHGAHDGHAETYGHRGQGADFGSGHWDRSCYGRGTNLTVVVPGFYSSFGVGSYYPGYYPGYGGFGGYAPYGYGSSYYPYPYVLPPVLIPAGEMYGPRAVWNMLGVVPDNMLPGVAAINALDPLNVANPMAPAQVVQQANPVPAAFGKVLPVAPAGGAQQPIKLRKVNDAARGRAIRLLAMADEDFRAQKYVEAAQRYRRAVQTAPDVAEAHFRQGQAEIALSHYEAAAKICKRGLEVDPAWIAIGFRLANLYGPNQAAKAAHLEKLAQEAAAHPQDTDLRFLIGIELFLDGQFERSRKFFEQAAALNRGDDTHLLAFLRELDRRAPMPQEAAIDL